MLRGLDFYPNQLKRSDSLVSSLMKYAINTGMLTSAASISTLILVSLLSPRF